MGFLGAVVFLPAFLGTGMLLSCPLWFARWGASQYGETLLWGSPLITFQMGRWVLGGGGGGGTLRLTTVTLNTGQGVRWCHVGARVVGGLGEGLSFACTWRQHVLKNPNKQFWTWNRTWRKISQSDVTLRLKPNPCLNVIFDILFETPTWAGMSFKFDRPVLKLNFDTLPQVWSHISKL